MTEETAKGPVPNPEWQEVLAKGHAGQNYLRRVLRVLPSEPRCKVCNNPFGGMGGKVCGMLGMKPSKKNPNICALCCENMPRGGAEVETVILFADVRGSTGIAEKLGPTRYSDALNRFYATATRTLIRHDATIDKLIGDEVMAFFIPGQAGQDFRAKAVEAGRELMRRLGHDGRNEPELPIGVGIESGIAFVGNIGAGDIVDFTVLGDPVNMAARIQSAAKAGEVLVGDHLFQALGDRYQQAPSRQVKVKGKKAPLLVHSIPVAA